MQNPGSHLQPRRVGPLGILEGLGCLVVVHHLKVGSAYTGQHPARGILHGRQPAEGLYSFLHGMLALWLSGKAYYDV